MKALHSISSNFELQKFLASAFAEGSFLLGANDRADNKYGRISTKTVNGSAVAIDSGYSFGEAIELRYTSSKTNNSQFQGIFLDVRTSAANSSTIRGVEITAQSEGNINVGTLEGIAGKAIPRGTSGTITNAFGVTGEVTQNSSSFVGTITTLAAVRGKVSLEDGGTFTNSSVFLAETEAITGAETIGSYFRAVGGAGITASALIDATGVVLATVDTDKVNLIKFRDSGGDEVILRVADGGTVSVAGA